MEALFLGGHVDKHEGLAVSSQRVLQEVRQLRFSIGDVPILSNTNVVNIKIKISENETNVQA